MSRHFSAASVRITLDILQVMISLQLGNLNKYSRSSGSCDPGLCGEVKLSRSSTITTAKYLEISKYLPWILCNYDCQLPFSGYFAAGAEAEAWQWEERLCVAVSQDAQTAFMFVSWVLSLEVVIWLCSSWLYCCRGCIVWKTERWGCDDVCKLCWICVVLKLRCVVLMLCCVEAVLYWSCVIWKLCYVEAVLYWSCVVLKLSWSRVRWQLVASEQCACAAVVARSVRVPGRRPSVNIGQWSR